MNSPSAPNRATASVLQEVAELVPLVVEGLASDEQFARLNALLSTQPQARQYYLEYLDLHVELVSLSESNVLAGTPAASGQAAAHEDDRELYWYEREEFAPLSSRASNQDDTYTFAKAISLLGYVGAEAARRHAVALMGLAALLVIAVVLGFVLIGNNDGDSQPVATDNPLNDAVTPTAQPVVAVLTAEHDAVWATTSAEGASAPGSPLRAGDRLTLTAGFAEITTNRGAIATLQAPATIELVDHDNAIRLHAGKLVGLCETESSKGFTVHTAHGDVVDLGTEFGVLVNAKELTATVFTGEITLTPPGGQAQPITTKQTAKLKVDGNDRRLVVRDQPAKGFDKVHAVALTKTATLPGTGYAAVGQTDPYWSIAAIDGLALLKPVAATVTDPTSFTTTNRANMRFMPNNSASKWITPLPHYKPSESVEYQTTFDASGFDLQTLSLELRLLADQRVTEIELNGRPVDVPTQGTGPAFVEMTELTLREGFLAGQNTLSLTVQRYRSPGSALFWTGLRAELELTSQRPSVGPNE